MGIIIIIRPEILTVDGIEVQCRQAAATEKRRVSNGSNAGRYGYRSFCTRALYQSVLNVIVQHSVY